MDPLCLGHPSVFYFFTEKNTFFQFVTQVLFIGNLFDEYFFLCHLPVAVLSPASCARLQSVFCLLLSGKALAASRRKRRACTNCNYYIYIYLYI